MPEPSPVTVRAEMIHAALLAGAPPEVSVVQFSGGDWKVRWGAAEVTLDCHPAGARELADVLESESLHPGLRHLLRLAADVCDQKMAEAAP